MSQATINAVLAGTKGFAVAFLAPLTSRVGNRPRVASDPVQILTVCSGPSSLAVVEFTGEGSLQAIQALVRDGKGLRIVAGVPAVHAAAEGTLRALGIEVGRWDGKVDGVIGAVDRILAASRPAAAPAAPASRAPTAPPAARPPRLTPSPVARPAAAPLAPAPGVPVAPRPATAPPAAARPPAPGVPTAPRPGVAPALTPAPGVPVAPRPAAAPAVAQARPPPSSAARIPAPPVAPRPAARFFEDLPGSDVSVVAEGPAPGSPVFSQPAMYAPPVMAQRADWPGGTCSVPVAEDALRRALGGVADPSRPLHALAIATLGALSSLERAVLSGEPQAIDATPIRKAAVMRLRVAEALAATPAPGTPVDMGALSAILGEIDGLLAEVAALLSGAPAELTPALESVRNALVSEAINFSEAASKLSSGPAPVSAPAVPSARGARVLSFETVEPVEQRGRGKQIFLVVTLVIVAAAVGAYHFKSRLLRPSAPAPTFNGAPAGTVAVDKGKVRTLQAPAGSSLDPVHVMEFEAAEKAKGNTVREVVPGVWISEPSGDKGGKP
jgi:hypothetical protein